MRTAPFDAAAAGYDAAFTERPLGRILRARVRERLAELYRTGDRVLELGCGTGEDALWLAARGVRVTATDVSEGMLAVAKRKAEGRAPAGSVVFERLDLARLDPASFGGSSPDRGSSEVGAPPAPFDGGFSNFGALNCVEDRRAVGAGLGPLLRPGAPLLLVVMGPLCPWEIGWYLLRLSPRTALRRMGGGGREPGRGVEARVGDPPSTLRVWYPSPATLRAELAPWFRHRETAGLGVVLPPTELGHLVERRPAVLGRLAVWDRRLGRRFPGTRLNDHYMMLLERR